VTSQARNHGGFEGKVYSLAPGLSAQKLRNNLGYGVIHDGYDGYLFSTRTLKEAKAVGRVVGIDWTTMHLGELRDQVKQAWPALHEAGAR